MRNIATLAILLILFVGIAGATMPNPTYNSGPQSGIKVQALEVVNDAQVKGNLYCNGTTVVNGAITSDTTIGAGSDFTAIAGNGVFNWAAATGFFNTSTGTNYANGNVIQATLKNYTMQGASTFTSGTGAYDINGPLTTKGITQDANYSLAQSGAAGITVGTTGITASASPIKLLENATLAANKSLTGLSGSGAVDFSAMTGGYSSPLGTNTFNGNMIGAGITTFTTGAGAVSLVGPTTLTRTLSYSVNASTTVDTVLTSASTKTAYGIDAHSANVTLTLPDAATVTGRIYKIATNVDPGTYYVKVTATGADKLGGSGGATTLMTTSGAAGISLISDGTLYLIDGAYGTWV